MLLVERIRARSTGAFRDSADPALAGLTGIRGCRQSVVGGYRQKMD
jgi:hypothetical protein